MARELPHNVALSDAILEPRDCVFAYALPRSEEDFIADLGSSDKEFARMFNGIWEVYEEEVAAPADKLLRRYSLFGATVATEVTLQDFGSFFARDFKAIILMAHWSKKTGAVELADGFAQVSEVLSQIPSNAERILDLSICHPEALVRAVLRGRPGCITRFTTDDVTPAVGLYFYFMVLHQLRYEKLTYLQALERIIGSL